MNFEPKNNVPNLSIMAALATLPLVRSMVPDSIFKRARELVSSHKLHDVRFEGPGLEKSVATCVGSNENDCYSLSIILNADSPSSPVCQCSCPAAIQARGNLCKHVVALLLLRIKEVTKVSQQQNNALVLSTQDNGGQPSLSDSQATEPFFQCENVAMSVDSDKIPAVSSSSQVVENNSKRVLPCWMSGGFRADVKEAKEKVAKRGAVKRVKRNASGDLNAQEQDGEACIGAENTSERVAENNSSKDESITVEDHNGTIIRTRGTRLRKAKKTTMEETSFVDTEFEGALHDQEKSLDRPGRGLRERSLEIVMQNKRSSAKAPSKLRKRKAYVQSDLSEEDEAEVVDNDNKTNHDSEGLDLTSEDLISMARQHLEMEKRTEHLNHEDNDHEKAPVKASNIKKKGTIFSAQGWNEIVTKSLDAKNDSFSQHAPEKPELVVGCVTVGASKDEDDSQANGEACSTQSFLAHGEFGKGSDLKPAENVVEDMLDLFFGPSLSKTVNSKTECTQAFTTDMTRSWPLTENTVSEVVLPVNVNSAPQPKKKGSLKDKVMMFLNESS